MTRFAILKKTALVAGLAALTASAAAYAASASTGDDADEIQALAAAKLDLRQAIFIAEKASGDRAIEAEFEREDGAWIWSIETVGQDGSETEMEIDAMTGDILATEYDD